MASNQDMVTLVKDGTKHKFAPESVKVWLDRGWERVDDDEQDQSKAGSVKRKNNEAAAKQQEKES